MESQATRICELCGTIYSPDVEWCPKDNEPTVPAMIVRSAPSGRPSGRLPARLAEDFRPSMVGLPAAQLPEEDFLNEPQLPREESTSVRIDVPPPGYQRSGRAAPVEDPYYQEDNSVPVLTSLRKMKSLSDEDFVETRHQRPALDEYDDEPGTSAQPQRNDPRYRDNDGGRAPRRAPTPNPEPRSSQRMRQVDPRDEEPVRPSQRMPHIDPRGRGNDGRYDDGYDDGRRGPNVPQRATTPNPEPRSSQRMRQVDPLDEEPVRSSQRMPQMEPRMDSRFRGNDGGRSGNDGGRSGQDERGRGNDGRREGNDGRERYDDGRRGRGYDDGYDDRRESNDRRGANPPRRSPTPEPEPPRASQRMQRIQPPEDATSTAIPVEKKPADRMRAATVMAEESPMRPREAPKAPPAQKREAPREPEPRAREPEKREPPPKEPEPKEERPRAPVAPPVLAINAVPLAYAEPEKKPSVVSKLKDRLTPMIVDLKESAILRLIVVIAVILLVAKGLLTLVQISRS